MRELPPRARMFVTIVVGAAAVLGVWAVNDLAHGPAAAWRGVLLFSALFGVATLFATRTDRSVSVSVGYIVGLAALVKFGVAGAAVVGWAGIATGTLGRRAAWVKRIFNGAMFALCGALAGLAWGLLAGPVDRPSDAGMGQAIVATAAATLVYFLVNNGLVATVVSFTSGLSFRRVWAGTISWLAVTQLGYGLLGLLMAQLYADMGPVSAVFFLVPLLVARSAFSNYTQLREAYDATVRAFAQAVETKDYYTRGHSERVSRVTEMIAREWGMREDRVQVIRIAGMLHDVGKLGVPTRVLQKQGKLNELEFEAIKLHPLRGYEMLSEIDFLREALDGVYHHHERMDGRGYPMGLTDAEIPEFARIIMVADAFDSMTSTRSYRQAKTVEDAITELRRCEGVQFDHRVVDCLVAAIAKNGWEPHPEEFSGEQVSRDDSVLERTTQRRRSVRG